MKELLLAVDPDLAPFQQIMDQFRNLIERGELRAGDTLPTVRQLAGDLGVAPNTVARAYAELQEEGLLTSNGRRGTTVAAGVRTNDKPTRARKLHETIEQFLETLAHRGYSQAEITAALRRFVRE
ncbi:MAG TPA: GntR family transcriptional regulator [Candidatus Baltobacteraceae bacterium]|nr:GntR family transcriptional regulator [Candidatus Baltobacteraceae bacterium]